MNKHLAEPLAKLDLFLTNQTLSKETRGFLEKWRKTIVERDGGDSAIVAADYNEEALNIMLQCRFDYTIYGCSHDRSRQTIWFFWFDHQGRKWWRGGQLGIPHYYTGSMH